MRAILLAVACVLMCHVQLAHAGVHGCAVGQYWHNFYEMCFDCIPGGVAQHNFPYADLPAFIDPIKTKESVNANGHPTVTAAGHPPPMLGAFVACFMDNIIVFSKALALCGLLHGQHHCLLQDAG